VATCAAGRGAWLSRPNATRVLQALGELPFGVAREITPQDVITRGITMIGDTPNVDVLTRAWNVLWTDASRDFAVFEVDGVAIPTISLPLLIASKRTGRPQDTADILVLEAIAKSRGQ